MNWETLIKKVQDKKIAVVPAGKGWYNKQYNSRILLRGKRGNNCRIGGLVAVIKESPTLNVTRSRSEYSGYALYCNSPEQVSGVLDWIEKHAPADLVEIESVDCPVNDSHSAILDSEFPTIVRRTLYDKKYRYRIVANIPYGVDKDDLEALLRAWREFEDNNEGSMAPGARRRDRIGKQSQWFGYGGEISFYTDDPQLSFIMKLTYPDYYHRTEKAVLVSEL